MHILHALGWESLVLLVLVLWNGLFSMAEIALVSSRKARLQQMAESGDVKARRALDLISQPGRFLATVQVAITLVATFAGAFGGVTLADKLNGHLEHIAWLRHYSKEVSLFLVVVIVSYFQVILGELVPKAFALRHSEGIARQVAGPMAWLSRAAAPLVAFLNASTEALLRLMGARSKRDDTVTEEEVSMVLAQGTKAGLFHASQQEMMESVIEMGDRRITSLMTPRPDIVWLDAEAGPNEIRAALSASPYSRFPVCRGSFDDLLGVVHAKDLLAQCLNGETLQLASVACPIPVIPDSVPVLKALEAFRVSGETMAFVSDEYGSILGLITLDDVLRNILGGVSHATDEEKSEGLRRFDGSWLLEGTLPIEELKDLLDVDALPGDDDQAYQTLAGFVMERLGRIPSAGDHFVSGGRRYEVVAMEGHRVDKVSIRDVRPPAEAPTG